MSRTTANTLLTPAEVAARLSTPDDVVKVDVVLFWIGAGELRASNIGRKRGGRPRWRITEQALAEFLAGREARAASPAPARRARRKAGAVIQFFT